MLRRVQGKLAFGTLQDSSGRIQLFATAQGTPDFDAFCALSLGDWIGVHGLVMTTKRGRAVRARRRVDAARRGEASVPRQVARHHRHRHEVSAALRRPLGQRRRHAAPSSSAASSCRSCAAGSKTRGFLEVETPILQPLPGGAYAKPFVTHHNALDMDVYLRVAPELYLKRLIVGGFEKVFEIGRVFRNEGLGYRWNPEFTMLELYEAYADYSDIMQLTEQLIADAATELCGGTKLRYLDRDLDLTPPWRRATMTELIKEHAGIDVDLDTPIDELRTLCDEREIPWSDSDGPGKLVLELYEKTTEAEIWGPVFVCDYPKEVSPLARDHRSRPGYVERFEPIIAGREIGNAFSELNDPVEQRRPARGTSAPTGRR